MDQSTAKAPVTTLPPPMFLIDKAFYLQWSTNTLSSTSHPTKKLIASECLTGPILHQNIRLGIDCIAVSHQTWSQIKQLYPKSEQIRRYPSTDDEIVEANLMKIEILLMSNTFLEKLEKKDTLDGEMKLTVEVSRYMKIQQVGEVIRGALVEKGLEAGEVGDQIRVWRLSVKDHNLDSLFKEIRRQFAYSFRKYHIKIQGVVLDSNKNCDELGITPTDYLLLQFISGGIQCVYTQQTPIVAKCSACDKIQILTFGCSCKPNRFCSYACQVHTKFCSVVNPPKIRKSQPPRLQPNTPNFSTNKVLHVGLKNLKNTCYINAALQCVFHIPKLVKYLKENTFNSKKNSVAMKAKELLEVMTSGQFRSVSPGNIKREMGKIHSQFSGYQQHDSHQYLSSLIDVLNQSKVLEKLDLGNQNNPVEDKFIQKLFYGEFTSYLKCANCEKVHQSKEPFQSINISLPVSANFKFLLLNGPRQTIVRAEMHVQDLTDFIYSSLLKKIPFSHPYGLVFWNNIRVLDMDHFQTSGQNLFIVMMRPRMQEEANCHQYVRTRFTQCKSSYNNENYRTDCLKPVMICYNNDESLITIHKRIEKWFNLASQNTESHENSKEVDSSYVLYVSAEKTQFCPVCNKNCYGCPVPKIDLKIGVFIDNLKIDAGNPNIEIVFEFYSKKKCLIRPVVHQQQIASHKGKMVTLNKCLLEFSKPEKLKSSDGWKCSQCNEVASAIKTIKISKYPQYLIVHLKRFDKTCKQKINTYVDFPIKNLDITAQLTEEAKENGSRPLYDLVSVCNHYGKIDFGHYTAYCWTQGGWIHFNDEQCTTISVEAIAPSSSAYYMFYKLQYQKQ